MRACAPRGTPFVGQGIGRMALMKYQNIDGLDLEEVLEQELDLENTKKSP